MLFRNIQQPGNSNPFAAPGETGSASEESKLLWDNCRVLNDHFSSHQKALPKMMQMIKDLQATLEETRVAYNQVLQDRDAKRVQLVASEARLADVQRVVQRYTVVQEPVVASDGFTYERSTIKQYLDECEAAETHAYSQQTKEMLTETLIPNQSLKKLVELLKTVKPNEVPAATARNPIPPIRGGGGGNNNAINFLEDDDYAEGSAGSSTKPEKVFHASDLEAALSTPAAANTASKPRDRNNRSDRTAREEEAEAQPAGRGKRGGGFDGDDAPRRPARGDDHRDGGKDSTRSDRLGKSEGNDRQGGEQRQQKSEKRGGGASSETRNHPCLRVYGFCNFKDDCTFARYPYDACLNNIKGKCRFGSGCKELHVNAQDAKYQNPRAQNNGQGSTTSGKDAAQQGPPAPRSQRDRREE